MVRGIDSFRKWFRGNEDQYAIIGGTACDLLMTDSGLDFRATKDTVLPLSRQQRILSCHLASLTISFVSAIRSVIS